MLDSVKRISLQVLVLALASTAAIQTWRLQGAQLEAAEAKTQQATQQAEAERLARVASETNRQLERQYREQVSEIETRAQADLAQSRVAVDRARDAGQRLQRELAGYVERQRASASAAAAAGQCQADAAPAVDLLAELFGRADERAGELAAVADEARIRGLACEASYDLVNSSGDQPVEVHTSP
ncbi:MAG: DUF2514 family protein [Curvibacter lanceolatus]|uniref:DUF2514 family protein n=1 Tax=Curvibacter lanceolatus TaxID=86182 RepID=UPI00235602D9|nr:DUF2514 family protein [Curvibacter lanceolatus]MBV5295527.1 DUF2514 family protein [Curvibacter lanceolatus]